MSNYIAVDIDRCRALNHRYSIMGSDKTPMSRHLLCLTCTIERGKTAIAAYGIDTLSWGKWRTMTRDEEEPAKTETL